MRNEGRTQPRSLVGLWLGIVGPPLVWLAQFEVKYALASIGNATRHLPLLIATSVSAAAILLFVGYVTIRERQMATASPLDAHAGVVGRNRFMATLGVMSTALFLLLVIAQALADFFFEPGHP